ncbi:TPA: S49 family peptidase [Citrobacter freundii]|nr:S49 family peptidase [Citrobacter freundii]HAT2362598.1 S49 family peptidase [Citrobacter freundii]HCD1220500.1 S49 family peptidase [Citrobacter freundii]HCD1225836.1 S49 family peptidase [Citrobacter freundii]HCD1247498.1 S49 family peptidase [Citrobacter freundii]
MKLKMINLPHLADQVFGVPHYATRQIMDSVKAVLVPRLQGNGSPDLSMAFEADDAPEPEQTQAAGGIAVIPVHGILVPRRGQITAACTELTSYERIRSLINVALNDAAVSEIVLDINSGGGAAVGCKELADYIFQSRDVKPITAIVNFSAYSAAYFIASACSKVIVSQTSGVGSIGVIMEHMEASKWEENIGLKFTTIFRGDNKNNGSQHEPLSEQAQAMFQGMIDDMYETFTSSVAEYRGLNQQAVIDTQAAFYFGADAVSAGLADEVSDPQSAINSIAEKYRKPQQSILLRASVMDMQTQL